MLLTRSPLGLPQCCHCMDLVRLACVRHAASVRPEPGSNSPSRSRARHRGGGPFDRLEEPAIPGPDEGSRSFPTGTRTANVDSCPYKVHSFFERLQRRPEGCRCSRPHSLFRPLFCFQGASTTRGRCAAGSRIRSGAGGARWPFRWRSGTSRGPRGAEEQSRCGPEGCQLGRAPAAVPLVTHRPERPDRAPPSRASPCAAAPIGPAAGRRG